MSLTPSPVKWASRTRGPEPEKNAPARLGKYRLIQQVGRGGMAEIWRARLEGVRGFKKQLAIKRILPQFAARRPFITMFIQEAKLSSVLDHPNVAQIYDLGEADGTFFIAMEYVKGWDLLKVLTHAVRMSQPLPIEYCLWIVGEICKGLAHAHEAVDADGVPLGIAHLDVSPSNILIGEHGTVKLTDFGVARAAMEENDDHPPDHLRGKMAYMSPEQVEGKPVDCRSDLFSVGIVLYEMLTLERLFRGSTVAETLENVRRADIDKALARHPHLPARVGDILRKALRRDSGTRYQSARELEEALTQLLFDKRWRVNAREMWAFVEKLCRKSEETTGPVNTQRATLEWGDAGALGVGPPPHAMPFTTPADPTIRDGLGGLQIERLAGGAVIEGIQFTFKNDDDTVFGPVTYRELVKMLSTRSVSGDDLVCVNGGDWQHVRNVPLLTNAIKGIYLPEITGPTESAALTLTNTIESIVRLSVSGASGRLRVLRPNACKDLFFRRGHLTHISTNLKAELLGPYLLARGIITEFQLEQASRTADNADLPLGKALLQLGFMSERRLAITLSEQLDWKLQELLSWRRGDYHWYVGDRPGPDIAAAERAALPSLVDGVRRYVSTDEMDRYVSGLSHGFFKYNTRPPFDVGSLGLRARELRVVATLTRDTKPHSRRNLKEAFVLRRGDDAVLTLVLFVLLHTQHVLAVDPG